MTFRFAGLVAALLAIPVLPAMAACGNTSATSSPAQVVQAQVDAYNAHDIEAFAACYADDTSVIDLSGKRPEIKGQAALKQAFAFLGKVPKDFGVDIAKRVVNGPVVIDLEHLHGLPPGKHAPDSLAVYEVRNGKIAKLWFPPGT
ncbi:nuclear transport factor 2 family protein [Rhodanobacter sp. Col0626]|uniref:nuclear transport factor 2 family protein n=1 Tax=Rhodanobacter sp. Col0626 TaxID=3415679 RepID=UPI003CEF81C7